MINKITSATNPKIKNLIKLKEKAKERRAQKVFTVEGVRMFREAPPDRIRELYYTAEACDRYPELQAFVKIQADAASIYAAEVDEKVFAHISDTVTPQGVLAVISQDELQLDDVLEAAGGGKPFFLILERLQDPGNMGTIIRMAEGAGVTAVIVSSDSADIHSPKVVRSTMGSVFRMPVVISGDIMADVRALKENGIKVYAAHLDGQSFYEKDMTEPSAFIIGNEGNGISDKLSREADEMIKIPMLGQVESLNAAISAAVISYEVLRQRKYSEK